MCVCVSDSSLPTHQSNWKAGAINPPRSEEEVYGTTGRMPALVKDEEYDATQVK